MLNSGKIAHQFALLLEELPDSLLIYLLELKM
jgi:hypothetical protein